MAGEVKVDPAELDAKAAQISEPMPAAPGQPLPPCALQVAVDAVGELNKSAEMLRGFAHAGEVEATRLAEAFRSAAQAYRQIDEQAGVALDRGETAPSIPPVQPAPPATPSAALPPTPNYQCPGAPGVMLEQAAAQIEAPDQAASLEAFKSSWTAYAAALEARSASFDSGGMSWDGGAAEAAGAALTLHRTWLEQMASAARDLAGQAGDLADVHRSAAAQHPTSKDIAELDRQIMMSTDMNQRVGLMKIRQSWQEKSESILGDYAARSSGKPLDPPPPPTVQGGPPASAGDRQGAPDGRFKKTAEGSGESGSGSGGGGGGAPSGAGAGGAGGGQAPAQPQLPTGMPQADAPVRAASAQQPSGSGGGTPSGAGGGAPSGAGGGSPAGGGAGGMPSLPDLGGDEKPFEMPPLDDPSVNPASAGGGSGGGGAGGGGGGGVGPMPLQPNVGSVSVGPPAGGAAVPGAAGPTGTGGPGGTGGMGMGGGMPMHGANHGQGGQGEKKRSPGLTPDESLYEEDRAWTEAVIGNRPRRKDSGEGKDAK